MNHRYIILEEKIFNVFKIYQEEFQDVSNNDLVMDHMNICINKTPIKFDIMFQKYLLFYSKTDYYSGMLYFENKKNFTGENVNYLINILNVSINNLIEFFTELRNNIFLFKQRRTSFHISEPYWTYVR